MAGKLKPEELESVLKSLDGINRSLDSCLESIQASQKNLDKSTQCQGYLSYNSLDFFLPQSLKPVQIGFMLKDDLTIGSEASGDSRDTDGTGR